MTTTTNYTIETLSNLITEFYGDDVERLAHNYACDLVILPQSDDEDYAPRLEECVKNFQKLCDENALN